jgi:hypothetical protein
MTLVLLHSLPGFVAAFFGCYAPGTGFAEGGM